MDENKIKFLKEDFIFHLKHLAPDATGKWGIMNGQQMVEHFTNAVRWANGNLPVQLVTEGERLKKNYEFLMSEKPFRENTKNPLLSEKPYPLRNDTMQQAIEKLQQELNYFFEVYEKDPGQRILNPIFGPLNFEEQVQLLHKHAQHHLKQFGLI